MERIARGLKSTTVEIFLYYLTQYRIHKNYMIYNSRNFSILLNKDHTVYVYSIYNSRNFSILLNFMPGDNNSTIYNSRNFSILLNSKLVYLHNFTEPSNFIFIILYNICTIYVK